VAVGSDAASAAASPTPAGSTPVVEQVDGVKTHLTTLHVRDAELLAVIETANAVHDAEIERARAVRDAAVERATAEREAVRAEMASAERELKALVNAPVSGGRDPFEWLPDELTVMIMLMLPFEVLWSGECERVCLRWARLMESAPVKRRKREGRWAAYEEGVIKSRELEGHIEPVRALSVGLDGKVYSGSNDTTILVPMAHTYRLSWGTQMGYWLSLWDWMAIFTRGRPIGQSECGLVSMAPTFRPSWCTRVWSGLSPWD
jgi:hypothetical protein